jgi:hypothetical protein
MARSGQEAVLADLGWAGAMVLPLVTPIGFDCEDWSAGQGKGGVSWHTPGGLGATGGPQPASPNEAFTRWWVR